MAPVVSSQVLFLTVQAEQLLITIEAFVNHS